MDDSKIKQLEQIMALMKKYKVDHVELEDLKINKSYHEFPEEKAGKVDTDEDILFYSSDL